ncbi:squalene/phytoene synthase family protein [Paracoccus sp. (in: a-proteobacteria)]|uniref:squalene/phytoene synthase family protein n=1 Tax=Paracoccus sp. TaxID=267 RepID=UPI0026DEABDD|nr:squalene/phytoene synthase family protein [Paracoccus sp. (in: a-proteobacteria)]MDO5370235.1 squalene/phytoene synthase family protein [Paracoccus sp. (in: a-proteobacteria)]
MSARFPPELALLAERLRREDPDRFAMAMLAPAEAQARLVTLYVLNAELARTALAARDPLIAEMRVQWWVDRLGALHAPPPPHELLSPLWSAWGSKAAAFAGLAESRRHDAAREPFQDTAAVVAYADATGGALMSHAARTLGAPDVPALQAQGRGAALTAWLRAQPALQQLGLGLFRADPQELAALAHIAMQAFGKAAAARRTLPRAAAPALLPGPSPIRFLDALILKRKPPDLSDLTRRAALARLALTGRWWV